MDLSTFLVVLFSFTGAAVTVIGVVLMHVGANTINDYFDWNTSDADNPFAGPFNGGSRSKIGDHIERKNFLIISLLWGVILIFSSVNFFSMSMILV